MIIINGQIRDKDTTPIQSYLHIYWHGTVMKVLILFYGHENHFQYAFALKALANTDRTKPHSSAFMTYFPTFFSEISMFEAFKYDCGIYQRESCVKTR